MHAVTANHILPLIEAKRDNSNFAMLDVGCGFGFSTLLYAKLASLIRDKPFSAVGSDLHQSFIEKAVLNNQKYPTGKVRFVQHDFIMDEHSLLGN